VLPTRRRARRARADEERFATAARADVHTVFETGVELLFGWWVIIKNPPQMPREIFSQEPIICILRQVEAGTKVAEVCCQLGVTAQT
jgi:tripartite-type tricarboxylate transporter receptor subunit TctC